MWLSSAQGRDLAKQIAIHFSDGKPESVTGSADGVVTSTAPEKNIVSNFSWGCGRGSAGSESGRKKDFIYVRIILKFFHSVHAKEYVDLKKKEPNKEKPNAVKKTDNEHTLLGENEQTQVIPVIPGKDGLSIPFTWNSQEARWDGYFDVGLGLSASRGQRRHRHKNRCI